MSIPTPHEPADDMRPLGAPEPRPQPDTRPRAERISGDVWRTTGGTFETRDYQPGGRPAPDNGQRQCSSCRLRGTDDCDYCTANSLWEPKA